MSAHEITTEQSESHVVVRVEDAVVAETDRALMLHETGLPTRWYVPADDVRMDQLTASDTKTTCPFKGEASYYSFGDKRDVAWTYADPLAGREDIAGYLSFLGSDVTTQAD